MATKKKISRELSKITFPEIQLEQLLLLEEIFPDLRYHMTFIAIPCVIIAQIRALRPTAKGQDILNMDSVNTYIRTLLSKSYSIRYVGAALAIRRTLPEFVNQSNNDLIISTFKELIDNPKGASSTKTSLAIAMSSPERLRQYRRGIMLQFAGRLQSTCVYKFRSISADVEKIKESNLFDYLPYPTDSINLSDIFNEINDSISPNETVREFVDNLDIKKVPMEESLRVVRVPPFTSEIREVRSEELDEYPIWRKLAYNAHRNLK